MPHCELCRQPRREFRSDPEAYVCDESHCFSNAVQVQDIIIIPVGVSPESGEAVPNTSSPEHEAAEARSGGGNSSALSQQAAAASARTAGADRQISSLHAESHSEEEGELLRSSNWQLTLLWIQYVQYNSYFRDR